MGRYLPRDYEPIPDALLASGAELTDVTRRIARNQNWIWANQGAALASFGQEPMTNPNGAIQSGLGTTRCAVFAAPSRSTTGSQYVRVCALVSIIGSYGLSCRLRLSQLLPGEAAPGPVTPYDEAVVPAIGTWNFINFTARVRSGADPLVFVLDLIGDRAECSYELITATVLWDTASASVLGETPQSWSAISQSSSTPANRSMSAALLRAISGRTLALRAESPAPIFSHSFRSPRSTTRATGLFPTVGYWIIRTSGLQPAPTVKVSMRFLVTGQGAVVTPTASSWNADGSVSWSAVNGTPTPAPALVNGVYLVDYVQTMTLSVPAGILARVEVGFTVNTATSDQTSSYTQAVGVTLLGCTITQDAPSIGDLGLPGADTIPAAYQPLDDLACAPRSPVVAQNDRLGRRAGPYCLVKNLIWLAAKRSAQTLVADWVHRTQTAGYNAPNDAGDGLYRTTTMIARSLDAAYPDENATIPWADRANPTNSYNIGASSPYQGHHFPGGGLCELTCFPLTGGKVAAILRPEMLYMVNAPWPGGQQSNDAWIKASAGGSVYFAGRVDPANVRNGFATIGPSGAKPASGALMTIVGYVPPPWQYASGMQIALRSAYVYELPLTQGDLDALA